MKHGKRLNFEMKKLLVENELNPKEWLYVKNLNDKLVLINTKNNTIKELGTILKRSEKEWKRKLHHVLYVL